MDFKIATIVFSILLTLFCGGCAKKPSRYSENTIPIAVISPSVVKKPVIETKYDKFKDETISTYEASDDTGSHKDFSIAWEVHTPGKEKLNEKSIITGMIISRTSSWSFLECNDLIFLIDGVRYSPTDITHDGLVSDGVIEFVFYKIDFGVANRISSANSVQGKLCFHEFELSENDKKALKSMITREN